MSVTSPVSPQPWIQRSPAKSARWTAGRLASGNQQPEVVGDERDVAAGTGGGRPAARHRGGVEVVEQRKVGPAVPDRGQRLVGLGLDHGDLDGGPGRSGHGDQGGREQRLPGAGKGDHGQGLRPAGGHGAHPLGGGLQFGVDRVGGAEQRPAGVGEGDAAGAALDEDDAGAAFEGGDLLGHRRRCVVQRRGRRGEAARTGDFPQHGEAAGVDQQFS
jgi:hypothetical protein